MTMRANDDSPTVATPAGGKEHAGAPLLRVAALAVAVALGIGGVAFAMPAVVPAARASEAPASAVSETAAARPAPRAEPSASPTASPQMVQALAQAIATDTDVGDDVRSRMPRPAGGKRIHGLAIDDAQSLTVYEIAGSPEHAASSYASTLKAQGFAMKKHVPDVKSAPAARAAQADGEEAERQGDLRKTAFVFTKGDVEAIVTASNGDEAGALLTVVEGPRRGRP